MTPEPTPSQPWGLQHQVYGYVNEYGYDCETPTGNSSFECWCRHKIFGETSETTRLAGEHLATDHPDHEIPEPPR